MSDNIGVERIFPINSPFIDSITVNSEERSGEPSSTISVSCAEKQPASKENVLIKLEQTPERSELYQGVFILLNFLTELSHVQKNW